MDAVKAYRRRRKMRLDARGIRIDDEWKTIKGTHVLIDDGGQITKGPERLKNLSKGNSGDSKKKRQFEAIQKANPAKDDYHTWIRSESDIKSFEEVAEEMMDTAPDVTPEMVETAKKTGKIKVYSSHNIECGTFVTPSKMIAKDYAGSGTVKETEVSVDDVAWIDGEQGQFVGKTENGSERYKTLPKFGKEIGIGKEMRPLHTDYEYEEGDDWQDFTEKNMAKLKPIYKEHGIDACQEEWYKFRMARTTKDLKETSKDAADETIYNNVRQSLYDGWFRNADSSYKPVLSELITKSPEMRNAAMNLAYDNYKWNCKSENKEPLSFEEFLVTPIKLYRGERGQKHVEDDVFDAYTFDRKTAEDFSRSSEHAGESRVIEIEVRPIDTFGSMRSVGESEIWVPAKLSPVGYRSKKRKAG